MLPASRSALRSARLLRKPQSSTVRCESTKVPGTNPDAHSTAHAADNTHHQHTSSGPVNESFGRGFFITLAALPLLASIYSYTTADPNNPPWITRAIDGIIGDYKETWTRRNTLHTKAVEQAAFDRNLFATVDSTRMVDLKFPEQFNTGSPRCVSAGQQIDMNALIKHYEDKNREMAEKVAHKSQKQREVQGISSLAN